jgi:FG-GAP repeat protein
MRRTMVIVALLALNLLTATSAVGAHVHLLAGVEANVVVSPAVLSTDFNGDGFTDLAVGAPGEDVSGAVDAGAVNVFFGSSTGLRTPSQVLLQDNPETGDGFGAALSAERISKDAFFDLVVGAPGENVGGVVDGGAANVFLDTAGDLPSASNRTLLQDNPEVGDQFGAALVADFFTADTFAEVVVGAPGENVGGIVDAGAANGFTNTTGVLPGRSTQTLLQDNVETGDQFGAALTAGPFNGVGFHDLVVGAPGENVGGIVDAGAANVFYDTVPSVSNQTLLQDNVEAGDRFGAAMTVGFFSDPSQSFVDLAVGAPGENVGATVDAGAANVFYHTTAGGRLPGTSDQTLLQGAIEAGDQFGAALQR